MITHKAIGLKTWKLYKDGKEIDTVYGTYEDILKVRQEWNEYQSVVNNEDWERCSNCGLLHPGKCVH